jgi:hypothetical protein
MIIRISEFVTAGRSAAATVSISMLGLVTAPVPVRW